MLRHTSYDLCSSKLAKEPSLTREMEQELARRWQTHSDVAARDLLVKSQLRTVRNVVRGYRAESYATMPELIAEGNFGLLRAVTTFDPDRGTRLSTYAVFWIRASVSQYLVRSRSLVATGVHSKLLSRIRRERASRAARFNEGDAEAHLEIASLLALSSDELHALVERMDVRDVPWDTEPDGPPDVRLAEVLSSLSLSPEDAALLRERQIGVASMVNRAMSSLDERERLIVERRVMAHREERLTLAEIGRVLRVSRERARQLEERAMRKLKAALTHSDAAEERSVKRSAA